MENLQFCSNCGNKSAIDVAFCSKCGSKLTLHNIESEKVSQNPAVVLSSSSPAEATNKTEKFIIYPKANLGKRFWAYIIDFLFCIGPSIVLWLLSEFSGGILKVIGSIGFLVSIIWIMYYSLNSNGMKNGQSYGKKINGLMVVCIDTNKPCDKRRSRARGAGGYIIPIECLMVIFKSNGRRMGDYLAKTQVIEIKDYKLDF